MGAVEPDNQLGAMNLVDPEQVRGAAALDATIATLHECSRMTS
ncbi:hypothetical protein [Streptomyces sp. NBC_00035]